ncbi:MAG: nuclear transport factor 2 family protein [Candidatus Thorarchaeota archaeon]
MMMNYEDLQNFCNEWLNAWTGNRPQKLLSFYSEDAFYIDPANKEGIRGHKALLAYFCKLLEANPEWIWKQIEIFQTEQGFTLKWECRIPVGDQVIHECGLDIIEIKNMKITRNEVYFDRTALLSAIRKTRSK